MKLEKYMHSEIIPQRWSEEMIEERKNWRCKLHRHTGLSTAHANCYNRAHGILERKGFIDIETSNLKANFGVMFSWCVKTIGKNELFFDYLTHEDIESDTSDKRIIQTLIDVLWKYDRLVGHYSTYFDIPWIRTRAIHHDIEFPVYGMLYHTDVWKMAKKLLCLHSNRQDSVAQAVQHQSIKTRINPNTWSKVLFGSKKQRTELIKEVLEHNEQDVYEGEGNYLKLLPFYKEVKSSF